MKRITAKQNNIQEIFSLFPQTAHVSASHDTQTMFNWLTFGTNSGVFLLAI
jgi:hypothetical protein